MKSAYCHFGSIKADNPVLRAMCDVDRKYERLDQFSNKAQKAIAEAKRQRRPPPKVKCRKHTEQVVTELFCESCATVKPLEAFSNAARKHNNQARCRDCVSWTEADYGEATPLPAPMEVRAPDETDLGRMKVEDFDVNKEEVDDAIGDLDSMTISDDVAGVGRSDASKLGYGKDKKKLTTETLNNFPGSSRGRGGYEASSAPSATSDMASSAGTERPSRPATGVRYNAWGPDGQRESRTQSVTTGQSTAENDDSVIVTTHRSGFAKIRNRRHAPDIPGYIINSHSDEPRKASQNDFAYSDSEDEC